MSNDQRSTGIHWDNRSWGRARSAYVADLDADPTAPSSWTGWLSRAIEQHVERGPAARASLRTDSMQTSLGSARGAGFDRRHLLDESLLRAMADAIIADRRHNGHMISRSVFVREAARAAADEAQERLGRALPPPPIGRLPTHPPR